MIDPAALPAAVLAFLAERHLATLSVVRADGTPHVSPVGFTYDAGARVARVITFAGARKVAHVARAGRAALCQVDGPRWLTLEGPAVVRTDPVTGREAEARYGERYRSARARDDRAVIEITVERVLGRVG